MHNRACYVPVARAPVIAQFYLNNFHESMAHCRGWNAAGRLRQRNPVPSIGLPIKDTSVQPRTRAFITGECTRYEERSCTPLASLPLSPQPSHCWCWLFTWVREANALTRLLFALGEFAIFTRRRGRGISLFETSFRRNRRMISAIFNTILIANVISLWKNSWINLERRNV